MPSTPGVIEFRRLVRNLNPAHTDFYSDLTNFIEQGANELFADAWKFLNN